ncbi:MAG: LLM class flavin-dependent oxidoreductase [Acidimicrobiia bacterium]|nr:LLM class flavin-dependent oxidoreductase [Acidimicrobiia bacterium]
MTLNVGIVLPTRESMLYGERSGDPEPLIELAVAAEDSGLDSVWAGDSLFARPRPEPLTLLAGVAARTERVTLGTAVLLPMLRQPLLFAQQVGTLDRMASGRFILGVGAAANAPSVQAEFEAVGVDYTRRSSAMVAMLQRCRKLWEGDPDDVAMLPRPAAEGRPPIWVGGSGDKTLQRTGRHFDGWFPTAATPEAFARGWATVRAAAEAAGRDPDSLANAAYLTVTIGPEADAVAAQREHMEAYYSVPYEAMSKVQGCVAGSAERCLDWLGHFVDAGVEHLVVRFGSGDPAGQLEAFVPLADLLRGE